MFTTGRPRFTRSPTLHSSVSACPPSPTPCSDCRVCSDALPLPLPTPANPSPGFHKYSVAYQSTGHRRYNQPFSKTTYGPPFVQGDVIGVGYRPRTGAIFFTRNGKKLEEVVHGLKAQNFFPAVGANGPATVHVNFGQAGFVFIEANVKKWGLAPVTGSLAPPPPYGSEQGSILLETGNKDGFVGSQGRSHSQSFGGSPYHVRHGEHLNPQRHGRTRSGNNFRILPPTSPGPVRSPTDISLAHLVPNEDNGEGSSNIVSHEEHHDSNHLHLHIEDATNPPPGYASPPTPSSDDGRRSSTDSEDSEDNTPLIRVVNRNRGDSSATVVPADRSHEPDHPPVPSYSDAVRQGAGQQERSRSPSPVSSTDSWSSD